MAPKLGVRETGSSSNIGQRAITVTADAQSKQVGQVDPAFTYQVATGNLVGGDTLTGALSRAIAITEETVVHDRRLGFMAHHALILTSLGEMYAMVERLEDATAQAEQALAMARAREEPGHEAYALRLLGEIAARQEPPPAERARDAYRRAIALAEAAGLRPLQAHCHCGLGRLYRHVGKTEQAQEHLTTAANMYREMDMRFWLEKAEADRDS